VTVPKHHGHRHANGPINVTIPKQQRKIRKGRKNRKPVKRSRRYRFVRRAQSKCTRFVRRRVATRALLIKGINPNWTIGKKRYAINLRKHFIRILRKTAWRKKRHVGRKGRKPKKVVKKPVKKTKKHGFCVSSGDPHFITFSGQKFDNYGVGDYLVVGTAKFEVHTRQRKWHAAAVNRKIVARVNFAGDKIQINGQESVSMDGKKVKLAIGQTIKAPNGGFIKRYNQQRFKITGEDGSFVDAQVNRRPKGVKWPQVSYINLLVHVSKHSGVKGFCVSKKQVITAQGLFKKHVKPRKWVKKPCAPAARKAAIAKCVAAKIQKNHLKACASDVCLSAGTFDLAPMRRFEIRCKKDKKKFKKRMIKHRKHRHGRKHRRGHKHGHKHHHHGRKHGHHGHGPKQVHRPTPPPRKVAAAPAPKKK